VPAAGGTLIEEPSAFADLDFGDDPVEGAAAHIEAEVPPPVVPPAQVPASGGIAYITVTDAAGRVLFRRAATPNEVSDALRSADVAQAEGEAAMDRISYDRLFSELNAPPGAAVPDDRKL
jgi:hypothetical protein